MNSYILEEELPCCESSCLKSSWNSLPITNCQIWQEGLPLRAHFVYILYAHQLPQIPETAFSLTVLCIGKPDPQAIERENLDILVVKSYIEPGMLLSMVTQILLKHRRNVKQLSLLCRRTDQDLTLKQFLIQQFGNPLVLLGAFNEVLFICEDKELCYLPEPIQAKNSDFLAFPYRELGSEEFHKRQEKQAVKRIGTDLPYECHTLYQKGTAMLRLVILGVVRPITVRDQILLSQYASYLECRIRRILFNRYQGLVYFHQALASYFLHKEKPMHPEILPCIREGLEAISWKETDRFLCIALETVHHRVAEVSDLPPKELLTQHSLLLKTETGLLFIVNLTVLCHNQEWVKEELEKDIKNGTQVYGISTPFQNFYDFPDYCRQAQAAIRIGKKLHYSKKIYPFWAYALDYIIYEGWDALPPDVLLYGPLKALIEHDQQQHTLYCATLKTFFLCDMIMAATAKALQIHISTLKYRMNRIQEITELDFHDPIHKMYLQLVMYLLPESKS